MYDTVTEVHERALYWMDKIGCSDTLKTTFKTEFNNRLSRAVARASYKRSFGGPTQFLLSVASKSFTFLSNEEKDRTIAHEVAHLHLYDLYPGKQLGHSWVWRDVMYKLGFPNEGPKVKVDTPSSAVLTFALPCTCDIPPLRLTASDALRRFAGKKRWCCSQCNVGLVLSPHHKSILKAACTAKHPNAVPSKFNTIKDFGVQIMLSTRKS